MRLFRGTHVSVDLPGSLAQLVEQLAFNQLVAGSNPARPTIQRYHIILYGSESHSLSGLWLFFAFICTMLSHVVQYIVVVQKVVY